MFDVKQIRKVCVSDVRAFCIKYDLFTYGTVRQYDNFLQIVGDTVNWDDFVVVDTVHQIMFYSDTESEIFDGLESYVQKIAHLATLFERECVTTYYSVTE